MAVPARSELYRYGVIIAGKYRLAERLGVGAMGTVWSAVNLDTHGRVALKLIEKPEAELRHRLLREARACAAIEHKNVVRVFDVGQTSSEDPFLILELLHGCTLAELLVRRRHLPAAEAAPIARDIARGLFAAHGQGIVHRDLKPANVFLHEQPGEGAPVTKLLDFGVSKILTMSDGLRTVAGATVGSPVYMSPEQACGQPDVDFRTDIWSLGAVLYEMLTGERLFCGEAAEVFGKIAHAPIPRVSHRVRRVDRELDDLVAACLMRDRDQRPASADEIAARLDDRIAWLAAEPRGPLSSQNDAGGAGAPAAKRGRDAGSPAAVPTVSYTRARSNPGAPQDSPDDDEDAVTVLIETGPGPLGSLPGVPPKPEGPIREEPPMEADVQSPAAAPVPAGMEVVAAPLPVPAAVPMPVVTPLPVPAAVPMPVVTPLPMQVAAPSPMPAGAPVAAQSSVHDAGHAAPAAAAARLRILYVTFLLILLWTVLLCAIVLAFRLRSVRGKEGEPASPPDRAPSKVLLPHPPASPPPPAHTGQPVQTVAPVQPPPVHVVPPMQTVAPAQPPPVKATPVKATPVKATPASGGAANHGVPASKKTSPAPRKKCNSKFGVGCRN